jgi:hypothetical protein
MPKVVTLDLAASTLTATGAAILNDGVEQAVVTGRLVNTDGNPMAGLAAASLSLTSTGSSNTITAVDSVTDQNGEFEWTFKSTSAATKTLTLTALGGAEVAENATVTVTASDPWLANLGNVATLGSDLDFDITGDLTSTGAFGSASNVTDATAPSGDSKVARFVYPAGAAAGYGTGGASLVIPDNTVRIYNSFNMRMSSNYTVHPSNQKLSYAFKATDKSVGSHVLGIMPGSGETNYTSGVLRFNMQPQVSGEPTRYRNSGSLVPVRDVWYHIETLSVMNTVLGTADGIFRMWVDGVLHMDYTNVLFSDTGGILKWRNFSLDPYYGGNTPGHTIPTECYIYVDRWTVYTDTARS